MKRPITTEEWYALGRRAYELILEQLNDPTPERKERISLIQGFILTCGRFADDPNMTK